MRIIDYNTIKHQQHQYDMGCAFGKSTHNQVNDKNMTSKDLITFSEMIELHFPTVEAYVLHVRAHERQTGGMIGERSSFIDFKTQEDALNRA